MAILALQYSNDEYSSRWLVGEGRDLLAELKRPAMYLVDRRHLPALRGLARPRRQRDGLGLRRVIDVDCKLAIVDASYTKSGQADRRLTEFFESRAAQDPIFIFALNRDTFERFYLDKFPDRELDLDRDRPKTEPPTAGVQQPALPSFRGRNRSKRNLPYPLLDELVGDSKTMQRLRGGVALAARPENRLRSVLVQGPSGTGKSVIAELVHRESFGLTWEQTEQSLLRISCAYDHPQDQLFKLFGWAGTQGNAPYPGALSQELSIVLDDVEALPHAAQVRLGKLLKLGHYQPLGHTESVRARARVIAISGPVNLYDMTNRQQFHPSLYYRLRDIALRTEALRDHVDDLPALANAEWRRILDDPNAKLSKSVIDELAKPSWPGNVRELFSVLRSLALRVGTRVRPNDVRIELQQGGHIPQTSSQRRLSTRSSRQLKLLQDLEEVLDALEQECRDLPSSQPALSDFTRTCAERAEELQRVLASRSLEEELRGAADALTTELLSFCQTAEQLAAKQRRDRAQALQNQAADLGVKTQRCSRRLTSK